MLMDTGATASLIHQEEVDRLNVKMDRLTDNDSLRFRVADDRFMEPLGTITTDLNIGGEIIHHKFYVFPKLTSAAIFGIDLQRDTNCQIDINGKIATFWGDLLRHP